MKMGTPELILICVVALIVFGPSRLPELGRMAGKAIGLCKGYVRSYEKEWEDAEKSITEPAKASTTKATVVEEKEQSEVATPPAEAATQ